MEISEIYTMRPEKFSSDLQKKIYECLEKLNIPFERVDNSESHTMEDAVDINKALNMKMAKNVFLCNRKKTKFYLYVTQGDKPFVTTEFCGTLGIPRVSFAPIELFQEMLGVEYGAANIFCTLNDPECKFELVIDRTLLERPYFGGPDGCVTGHIKIKSSDLKDKFLPTLSHQVHII